MNRPSRLLIQRNTKFPMLQRAIDGLAPEQTHQPQQQQQGSQEQLSKQQQVADKCELCLSIAMAVKRADSWRAALELCRSFPHVHATKTRKENQHQQQEKEEVVSCCSGVHSVYEALVTAASRSGWWAATLTYYSVMRQEMEGRQKEEEGGGGEVRRGAVDLVGVPAYVNCASRTLLACLRGRRVRLGDAIWSEFFERAAQRHQQDGTELLFADTAQSRSTVANVLPRLVHLHAMSGRWVEAVSTAQRLSRLLRSDRVASSSAHTAAVAAPPATRQQNHTFNNNAPILSSSSLALQQHSILQAIRACSKQRQWAVAIRLAAANYTLFPNAVHLSSAMLGTAKCSWEAVLWLWAQESSFSEAPLYSNAAEPWNARAYRKTLRGILDSDSNNYQNTNKKNQGNRNNNKSVATSNLFFYHQPRSVVALCYAARYQAGLWARVLQYALSYTSASYSQSNGRFSNEARFLGIPLVSLLDSVDVSPPKETLLLCVMSLGQLHRQRQQQQQQRVSAPHHHGQSQTYSLLPSPQAMFGRWFLPCKIAGTAFSLAHPTPGVVYTSSLLSVLNGLQLLAGELSSATAAASSSQDPSSCSSSPLPCKLVVLDTNFVLQCLFRPKLLRRFRRKYNAVPRDVFKQATNAAAATSTRTTATGGKVLADDVDRSMLLQAWVEAQLPNAEKTTDEATKRSVAFVAIPFTVLREIVGGIRRRIRGQSTQHRAALWKRLVAMLRDEHWNVLTLAQEFPSRAFSPILSDKLQLRPRNPDYQIVSLLLYIRFYIELPRGAERNREQVNTALNTFFCCLSTSTSTEDCGVGGGREGEIVPRAVAPRSNNYFDVQLEFVSRDAELNELVGKSLGIALGEVGCETKRKEAKEDEVS